MKLLLLLIDYYYRWKRHEMDLERVWVFPLLSSKIVIASICWQLIMVIDWSINDIIYWHRQLKQLSKFRLDQSPKSSKFLDGRHILSSDSIQKCHYVQQLIRRLLFHFISFQNRSIHKKMIYQQYEMKNSFHFHHSVRTPLESG